MSQPYGYAGQPPYQQGGYNPQMNNPYQQAPPPPGWNPQQGPGSAPYIPPPPMHSPMVGDAYVETGSDKANFGFSSVSIRAAFIRKVFILVSIMLLVVTVMTAVPFMHHDTMLFVRQNRGLYWASYGVFMVVYFALMCCESVRRSFPSNLIATAILTLSIGYMTMMISAYHDLSSVLMCLVITTVCSAGIIVFSMQTKHDLTSMVGVLAIFGLGLFVFGIVAIISMAAFHVKWMYTVYAGLAALLFMAYLAIDVQMVMGGKKYEISPEDHIFAAIQIFIDIVYIFWMLLSLFGSSKD